MPEERNAWYTNDMKITRVLIIGGLVGFLALCWIEIFFIMRESGALEASNRELMARISTLEQEQKELANDIEYYSDENNLEKTLRERFNYKYPGEEMIIIVPQR